MMTAMQIMIMSSTSDNTTPPLSLRSKTYRYYINILYQDTENGWPMLDRPLDMGGGGGGRTGNHLRNTANKQQHLNEMMHLQRSMALKVTSLSFILFYVVYIDSHIPLHEHIFFFIRIYIYTWYVYCDRWFTEKQRCKSTLTAHNNNKVKHNTIYQQTNIRYTLLRSMCLHCQQSIFSTGWREQRVKVEKEKEVERKRKHLMHLPRKHRKLL